MKRLEELRLPPADPLYARAWHLAANVEALRALLEDYGRARATPPSSQDPADVEAREPQRAVIFVILGTRFPQEHEAETREWRPLRKGTDN